MVSSFVACKQSLARTVPLFFLPDFNFIVKTEFGLDILLIQFIAIKMHTENKLSVFR